MKKTLLAMAAMLIFGYAQAQMKLGNNPTTTNSNALLEMETTNKGLLLPRVALTNTTSFAPLAAHVAGMAVYNTATVGNVTPGYYFDNGTAWVRLSDASALQLTTGAGVGKILTSDAAGNATWQTPTVSSNLYTADGTLTGARTVTMGTNNLSFNGTGNVGIGTATPTNRLHLNAATNPLRLEGLQAGAASDKFVTVDATGVLRTLEASKPQNVTVRLTTAESAPRSSIGTSYHFTAATQLVNSIGGATIAANGDITVPAGTYQVVLTMEGGVLSDATPPPTFYIHSYYYDFPGGNRIHSNTCSNLGSASNHGVSITYTTVLSSSTIIPFNIGFGQGGNATTSANLGFTRGCQLSVTKLN